MFNLKKVRDLAFCFLTSIVLSGFSSSAFAQGTGAVPLPLHKPAVDQLGQMEGVPTADKTMLALGLFLQVIALVAVAVALAGHLSMPKKKKVQKT